MKTLPLLFALILAACGGGGEDPPPEERKGLQPVVCEANPELCR